MRSGWGQVPAVLLYGTSRQSSTLWLTGNVSWYRICVHRLPHRTCVCWLPHRTNIVFAYVGSLTGPTLAFCSMADSVTKFGLFRKSQQYILAAVTPSAASIRCIFHRDCTMVSCTSQAVGYHGAKFIHCILCLESIKHRYTFSLNLLWCKAVSSANNEIQSCRSQQFFGCSNLVASIRCILQKFALLHSRKKLDTMERQILLWCSNLGHFFMSVAKLSLARVSSFCSRGPHEVQFPLQQNKLQISFLCLETLEKWCFLMIFKFTYLCALQAIKLSLARVQQFFGSNDSSELNQVRWGLLKEMQSTLKNEIFTLLTVC